MIIQSIFLILIALAVSPLYEDVDLLFEKALESDNNSEFDEAILYLDKILKQEPDNSTALYNKAKMLMKLEKYQDSLLYVDKAIEINPNFVIAIHDKAVALSLLDRDSDALATFFDAYMLVQPIFHPS